MNDEAQKRYWLLRESYSDDELIAELERRKKENKKPKLVDAPDFGELETICVSIINAIADGRYHGDNDDAQWVYEAAMTAFFGKDIFEWINKNT